VIGDTTRTYATNATAMRDKDARYRDRAYGHARRDSHGRLWLQYSLFYYYNDFQLVATLLGGGRHEGDWRRPRRPRPRPTGPETASSSPTTPLTRTPTRSSSRCARRAPTGRR
jgi:hypothetical protein